MVGVKTESVSKRICFNGIESMPFWCAQTGRSANVSNAPDTLWERLQSFELQNLKINSERPHEFAEMSSLNAFRNLNSVHMQVTGKLHKKHFIKRAFALSS